MKSLVTVTARAEKSLRKIPVHILDLFDAWGKLIEDSGYLEMKKVPGYRDHALSGKLAGLRSVSLNRSYRVIYKLIESEIWIVEIIEVNKHDYKI